MANQNVANLKIKKWKFNFKNFELFIYNQNIIKCIIPLSLNADQTNNSYTTCRLHTQQET